MKTIHVGKKVLWFLLYTSIVLNVFLYQMYEEAKNEDFMWDLYRRVSFAASKHDADILKGVSVDRPDVYWSKKFMEVRQRGSDSSSLSQQILVEYDNGETLVIEVAENLEHEYIVNDLYFLEGEGFENE